MDIPKRPRPITPVHLSTSEEHQSIYKEVCRRRGLLAIGDSDYPSGVTEVDFDVWRFGNSIWKKTDMVSVMSKSFPVQRNDLELDWLGMHHVLETLDDYTNVVRVLNRTLPDVPFVSANPYDPKTTELLIEMNPTGLFMWVWDVRTQVSPGRYTTFANQKYGLHFWNESDAIAFVALTD